MKPTRRFDWWTSRLLAVCLLFLVCHPTVIQASIFSQTITDHQFMTRGNSPYYIRETIEIGKTGSLNIESGVIINFHPGAGILVKGALIAKVKLGFVCLFLVFYLAFFVSERVS